MAGLPPLPTCTATNADCIERRAKARIARGDYYTAKAKIEYDYAAADFALVLKLRGGAPVVSVGDSDAARFALKAGFSVSDADISAIKTMGYEPWLSAEMNKPIGLTGVSWLAQKGYDKVTIDEYYYQEAPGDGMIWSQILTQSDSVRKRIALALSEYFVVSLSGLGLVWKSQAIAHYWDQLNTHTFGNFRNLMEDVSLNLAMGIYLSTLGNKKENLAIGRQPDQNYAREIMQLFTIGLYELNIDGSYKLGADGKPIETYTQNDIVNLARVFTGYEANGENKTKIDSVRFPGNPIDAIDSVLRPMTADSNKWYWNYPGGTDHSTMEKRFLNVVIPAGTGAVESLKIALDGLFQHPNVGPFFAKQMIQRLVTSNPSRAYVERVAKIFNNDGLGVRGNLKAVFKAILLDPEAMAVPTVTYGKVREPMLRFAQWCKTFKVRSGDDLWKIGNVSEGLSQSPLRSPSVFNYFRPGYVPANTAIATGGLVAPEFQIVTEVTTAIYVNAMQSVIENGVGDVKPDYTAEIAIAHDSVVLLNRICLLLAANQITAESRAVIKTAIDAIDAANKLRRVHTAILLVMAAPDYLIQK